MKRPAGITYATNFRANSGLRTNNNLLQNASMASVNGGDPLQFFISRKPALKILNNLTIINLNHISAREFMDMVSFLRSSCSSSRISRKNAVTLGESISRRASSNSST